MTSKATPKAKPKTNGKAAPRKQEKQEYKETYKSIKDGEIKETGFGKRMKMLFDRALS